MKHANLGFVLENMIFSVIRPLQELKDIIVILIDLQKLNVHGILLTSHQPLLIVEFIIMVLKKIFKTYVKHVKDEASNMYTTNLVVPFLNNVVPQNNVLINNVLKLIYAQEWNATMDINAIMAYVSKLKSLNPVSV